MNKWEFPIENKVKLVQTFTDFELMLPLIRVRMLQTC